MAKSADNSETRMPFGEHLEELRTCLIRALIGVVICTIVSLIFAKGILAFILAPALIVLQAHGERPELLALHPAGPFLLFLKVGFLCGLVISTPWVLYQAWQFVATGLYARERRFARNFAPFGLALFATGVTFMFYIVLPIVLNFFVVFSQGIDLPDLKMSWFQRLLLGEPESTASAPDMALDVRFPILDEDPIDPPVGTVWINNLQRRLNVQTPNGVLTVPLSPHSRPRAVSSQYGVQFYISFVFSLALGFGLAFELPVVVILLAVTGLVPTQMMAKGRRYVMFAIVVLAAILTPPDVISQVLLAVPMIVLFEAGLIVARRFERRG